MKRPESYRVIRRLFVAISLFGLSLAAHADDIVIAGDNWCPFNCEPGSAKPGYMVEIAQRVLGNAGHKLEYRVVPWARAVEEARQGKLTGIIGAYVDDAPDFAFPKHELAMAGDGIFVLKSSPFVYKDLSSLGSISIGVINGYAYGSDELNAYIKKNAKNNKRIQFAQGDKAQEMNLTKLVGGRMEAVVENPSVFWYTAAKMKLEDKVKVAGTIGKPKPAYIAFSPANPKAKQYAAALSDGIEALRKSGELKAIMKKYGLDDWR